ncbi:hypothetical protein RDABS01_036446 [Bienertia sinuspersici]
MSFRMSFYVRSDVKIDLEEYEGIQGQSMSGSLTIFSEWLKNKVHDIDTTIEQAKLRKALAGGLYEHAKEIENAITQHKIQELWLRQMDKITMEKVVVFRCDWVDISKGLKHYENGGICVNFSKLMHRGRMLHDDPFIFSSQVKQVFYIEDEMQKGWLHAIESKPRDIITATLTSDQAETNSATLVSDHPSGATAPNSVSNRPLELNQTSQDGATDTQFNEGIEARGSVGGRRQKGKRKRCSVPINSTEESRDWSDEVSFDERDDVRAIAAAADPPPCTAAAAPSPLCSSSCNRLPSPCTAAAQQPPLQQQL